MTPEVDYIMTGRSGARLMIHFVVRDIDNSGLKSVYVSADRAGTAVLFDSRSSAAFPLIPESCPSLYEFDLEVRIRDFPVWCHVTDCEDRNYGEIEVEDSEPVGPPIPVPPEDPAERCQEYHNIFDVLPNYACRNAIDEVNRVGNDIRRLCEEQRILERDQTNWNITVSVLGGACLAALALASLPFPIGLVFGIIAVVLALALGVAIGFLESVRRRLDGVRRALTDARDLYQSLVERANEVCCPWDPHPDPVVPTCS